jgi:GNAT superfamily N-acetyltransferase
MLEIQIRESRGLDAIAQVRQVRFTVLREPLGMPFEETLFPGDENPETRHILAYRDSQPIGCLTLMPPENSDASPSVQLRGMAVLADMQGQGIGSQLLDHVARLAKENRWKLWCKARQAAVPFYQANGWHIVDDGFDIPIIGLHFRMEFEQ